MVRSARFHRRLGIAASSSAIVLLTLLVSAHSTAVPGGGSSEVSGVIEDMWLDSDICYFRIAIEWSDNGGFDGATVDAIPLFLNESTDRYERIAGSEGWRPGDEVNATLEYVYDETGRTYWIELSSKSDENYAEPLSYFEQNPFVLYLLIIVGLFIVLQVILFLVSRRKGKSGRYEGPDYVQYMRRI